MDYRHKEELQILSGALQNSGFRFIVVEHNRRTAFLEVKHWIEERWAASRKVTTVNFGTMNSQEIRDSIEAMSEGILLIPDFDALFRPENETQCLYFNQRRDYFAKLPIAFICFVQPSNYPKIAERVPDWWSLRSLELEYMMDIESNKNEFEGYFGDWLEAGNLSKTDKEDEIAYLESQLKVASPMNKVLLYKLNDRIGLLQFRLGQLEQAIQSYKQCLEIGILLGDVALNGHAYDVLSHVYFQMADYQVAMIHAEKALAYYRENGNRNGEGSALNIISQIYSSRGDNVTALSYMEQALTISLQEGNYKEEGVVLNNISRIYKARGDYDTALKYLEDSLFIRQKIGDRLGEGTTLNNISQIYYVKGDYDTALSFLEKSLVIKQQIGDKQGEGTTLNNFSGIFLAQKDYKTALYYLRKSLTIRHEIGDISGKATTLSNIGAILIRQEEFENAIPLFREAFLIFEQIGSPNVETPKKFLNEIKKRIGEARYNEIVSSIKPWEEGEG